MYTNYMHDAFMQFALIANKTIEKVGWFDPETAKSFRSKISFQGLI